MDIRVGPFTSPNAGIGRLLAAAGLGLMAACSTVATTTPQGERTVRTREEFERYVEQVFRYQNLVGNDLIARSVSSEEMPPALAEAEEHMVRSCHALNAVVIARAEDRDPGLALKRELARTIAGCDQAAQAVGRLLQQDRATAIVDTTSHL
ncbi:MAG: hypothetical protein IT496_10675 [Gammaproteobacteria bacterium]|nr:hypothetical protein [Gammaproteobacteria bacterium]MCG3143433.1 hypothetical protein [Gammaproteobacteria bacterium]